jgi:hypothetical protein
MIIACDGIWDCFTNEQAVKFVINKRTRGPKNGAPITTKFGKTSKDLTKKPAAISPGLKLGKTKSEGTPIKKGLK